MGHARKTVRSCAVRLARPHPRAASFSVRWLPIRRSPHAGTVARRSRMFVSASFLGDAAIWSPYARNARSGVGDLPTSRAFLRTSRVYFSYTRSVSKNISFSPWMLGYSLLLPTEFLRLSHDRRESVITIQYEIPAISSRLETLQEERNNEKGNDINHFNQRVYRGTRSIFIRVPNRVPRDRRLMRIRTLAAECTGFNVLFRVVPRRASGGHGDADEKSRNDGA